jgi:broad specificity phosphatase PhoE
MLKKVIFIRHGETGWNAERRWQGHTDIPLNERGRSQAREVAAKIQLERPQVLLSSDLVRAAETAGIIAESFSIPIYLTRRIREVGAGEAEGLTLDQIVGRFGEDAIQRWRSLNPEYLDFSFPGGEAKRQALKRGREVIEQFVLSTDATCVGIVFHGMIMRTLLHSIFPELREPVKIGNCKHFILLHDVGDRRWFPEGELEELVSAA